MVSSLQARMPVNVSPLCSLRDPVWSIDPAKTVGVNAANATTFDLGEVRLKNGECARLAGSFFRPRLALSSLFKCEESEIERTQSHGLEWAKGLRLLKNPRSERAIARCQLGYNFRSAVLNTISQGERDLVSDFTSWYFYVDDVIDEVMDASTAAERNLIGTVNVLIGVLLGQYENVDSVPRYMYGGRVYGDIFMQLCRATFDISDRVRTLSPQHHKTFVEDLAAWLRSIIVERKFNRGQVQLHESSYMYLREQTIGMYPMYDIGAIVSRIDQYFVERRQSFDRHRHMAVLLVVFINDIISLAKELRARPEELVNNLVMIRYRNFASQGIGNPLQSSIDSCINQFNLELRSWYGELDSICRDDLPHEEHDSTAEQSRRLDSMYFNGVLTNIDWHVGNPRYRVGGEVTSESILLSSESSLHG